MATLYPTCLEGVCLQMYTAFTRHRRICLNNSPTVLCGVDNFHGSGRMYVGVLQPLITVSTKTRGVEQMLS